MKNLKKMLVFLLILCMTVGMAVPANAVTLDDLLQQYTGNNQSEQAKEELSQRKGDPELIWTDGRHIIDRSGTLWKFAEYLDGRWSMEGAQKKLAENVVYAGVILTEDGKIVEMTGQNKELIKLWPENKKIKFASFASGNIQDSIAVVDEQGNLWVWGGNYNLNLGCMDEDGLIEKPRKIMTKVEKVYLFGDGGCAIKKDGSLWSWGPDGPYLKKSDMDITVGYYLDGNGYYESHYVTVDTTTKPKKVLNNVKDIWYAMVNPVVLKRDGTLYDGTKKIDTNVKDVFVSLPYITQYGSIHNVIYLKEDSTLWGYGRPSQLGLKKGNTKLYGRVSANLNDPEEYYEYQSVPIKLLDDVAVIMNGEHYNAYGDNVYFLMKDGTVTEFAYSKRKEITPKFYIDLFYYESVPTLTAKEQKIKDNIEAATVKTKIALRSDGKVKLTWTKSEGNAVNYYEVYRATAKKGPYNLQYTTKSGKQQYYNNTSAKAGKRYYYVVRGVREVDGKKYYTNWSKPVYITAK